MTRPAPRIQQQRRNSQGKTTEILDAPGLWILTYAGSPCQIRWHSETGFYGYKYSRAVWTASPAHALNTARRLNDEFDTDLFAVAEVVDWKILDAE